MPEIKLANNQGTLRLPLVDDVKPLFNVLKDNGDHLHDWRVFLKDCDTPNKLHHFISENNRNYEVLMVSERVFNY